MTARSGTLVTSPVALMSTRVPAIACVTWPALWAAAGAAGITAATSNAVSNFLIRSIPRSLTLHDRLAEPRWLVREREGPYRDVRRGAPRSGDKAEGLRRHRRSRR